MQGLVSKVDHGCQTEGSWTATAEQLQEAKAEGSALQKEVSSLRHALSTLPCALIVPTGVTGSIKAQIRQPNERRQGPCPLTVLSSLTENRAPYSKQVCWTSVPAHF